MLRISKKADYAVFLLGAIARQGAYPGGQAAESVVSAQEISKQAGLNKSVVANLLKEFGKHGILESVRGLRGGYRLARAPSAISLAEILEVVEGRFALVDCVAHDQRHAANTGSGGSLPSALPLVPSALPLAPSAFPLAPSRRDDHDCSLMSFCPSRRPMRLVHDRIAQVFRETRLDELCALPTANPGIGRAPRAPTTNSVPTR